MDFDEYREYYFSRSYVRNRILLIAFLVLAIGIGRLTGLLEPSTSGMAGRAYALQILVLVIVVGWIVIAAIGLVGLVRCVRAQ